MTDAIAHRGPDGEGHYVDGAGRPRPPAAGDHRPHRRRRAADGQRGRRLRRSPTTARSTTSASCATELEARGHRFRSRTDTEVVLHALRRSGARPRSSASTACSRFALWDRREPRAACSRATATASSRSTTPQRRHASCSAPRSRRCLAHPAFRADARARRSAARVLHVPEHLHRPHAVRGRRSCCRPGHCARSARDRRRAATERYWDFDFREPTTTAFRRASTVEELDRLLHAGGLSASSSATCRSARYLSGGMDSGTITAVAARAAAVPEDVHRSASTCTRPPGSSSASTSAQGRGTCPTSFETEHYEMVLKAGDMERCLPRARLAPRGAARRPELSELLRRAAGEQVRQGRARRAPAATSCSAAIRGATTARSSTTTSSTTSTSTTTSGSGSSRTRRLQRALRAGLARGGQRRAGRATSSATSSRPRRATSERPEDYVNHSLYLEAQDVPARPARRRGQAEHGARPRDARAVPRQRPGRLRAARAGRPEARQPRARSCGSTRTSRAPKAERYFERTRDGKLLLRQVMERYVPERGHRRRSSRASPAPTRAGSAARASTTSRR